MEKQTHTVREVCEMTGFCTATVIRLFEEEPGVIILMRPEKIEVSAIAPRL
jgi:hypothetical protein